MSSRLMRSADCVEALPIAWRQAGGTPVQAIRLRASDGGRPDTGATEIERQMEARVEAAYQQGRAAGETETTQRASQRLEPVLAGLNGILQELTAVRKKFRAEAEEDTVKLAIAIARRILHRELATDPEAILGLVMSAFQKLNARETHRLRVSAADAAALEQNRARLELPPGLEIVSDASLVAGSATFETTRGELDASVDTQLAEIQRGFADIIGRRAK